MKFSLITGFTFSLPFLPGVGQVGMKMLIAVLNVVINSKSFLSS